MENQRKIYIELLDCGVTYDCENAEDVQNAIIEEYDRNDVTIQSLLTNIAIYGLSADDVTYIYGNLLNKINGDELIQFYNCNLNFSSKRLIEEACDGGHAFAWYE